MEPKNLEKGSAKFSSVGIDGAGVTSVDTFSHRAGPSLGAVSHAEEPPVYSLHSIISPGPRKTSPVVLNTQVQGQVSPPGVFTAGSVPVLTSELIVDDYVSGVKGSLPEGRLSVEQDLELSRTARHLRFLPPQIIKIVLEGHSRKYQDLIRINRTIWDKLRGVRGKEDNSSTMKIVYEINAGYAALQELTDQQTREQKITYLIDLILKLFVKGTINHGKMAEIEQHLSSLTKIVSQEQVVPM